MKKTIWKYPLKIEEGHLIALPLGAKVLSFGISNNVPCIWVMVNPDEQEKKDRVFMLYGTGEDILNDEKTDLNHIGTVEHIGLKEIWHLFEVVNKD